MRRALAVVVLALLAGCGGEEYRARETPSPAAAPVDILAHTVRAPRGWKDLSDDPPAPVAASYEGAEDRELENYFLRGTVGRQGFPVAVLIGVERVPRSVSVDGVVAADVKGLRTVFAGQRLRLGEPRPTTVAGEGARTYDVSYLIGEIPAVQRVITFKRGPFAAYQLTLTAPTPRALAAAAPGLRAVVRSWRWTG